MNTYKITNITDLLEKRDYKYNATLIIDYVDDMTKKTIKLEPNNSVYLTTNSLPLSVHRLRVRRLVSVVEIDKKQLDGLMKKMEESKSTTKAKTNKSKQPKINQNTVEDKTTKKPKTTKKNE